MDEELQLALCVIKVLCLIVIAMSVYKMANPPLYSYMSGSNLPLGANTGGASMRFNTSIEGGLGTSGFVGDGAYETPVFWNNGDYDMISKEQSSASRDFGNFGVSSNENLENIRELRNQVMGRLNSNNYVGSEVEKSTARSADLQLALNLGLVQGPSGQWVVGGKQSSFGNKSFMSGGKLSERELGLANAGL